MPLRGEDGQILEAEPIPIAVASSGSVSVRGRVPPEYIENIAIDVRLF